MSTSKQSWEQSSDSFTKKYEEAEKAKRLASKQVNLIDLITHFLQNTTIPYIVIGGKAAIYHLNQMQDVQSSENKKLATLSNDYDLYSDDKNAKELINSLEKILSNRGLEKKEVETDTENITMIGNIKNKIFESVIDIHVPKTKIDISSIKGIDGIQYASLEWICNDLKNILENKSSQLEIVKYEKRKARFDLLQCKKII